MKIQPLELLSIAFYRSVAFFFKFTLVESVTYKQGRKRPLDTPKRMIKRREREGKREKER